MHTTNTTPGVHLSLLEKHAHRPHNYKALTCRMHLNNLVPDNLDNSASCVKMANRLCVCVCVCALVSGAVNAIITKGDRAVRNHSVINGTVALADHCGDLQTLWNVFSLFYFNMLRLFPLQFVKVLEVKRAKVGRESDFKKYPWPLLDHLHTAFYALRFSRFTELFLHTHNPHTLFCSLCLST